MQGAMYVAATLDSTTSPAPLIDITLLNDTPHTAHYILALAAPLFDGRTVCRSLDRTHPIHSPTISTNSPFLIHLFSFSTISYSSSITLVLLFLLHRWPSFMVSFYVSSSSSKSSSSSFSSSSSSH